MRALLISCSLVAGCGEDEAAKPATSPDAAADVVVIEDTAAYDAGLLSCDGAADAALDVASCNPSKLHALPDKEWLDDAGVPLTGTFCDRILVIVAAPWAERRDAFCAAGALACEPTVPDGFRCDLPGGRLNEADVARVCSLSALDVVQSVDCVVTPGR